MIDSFDLYERLIGNVNTHQGGHVRPNRNFIKWVNAIRLEIFKEAYAEFEKTQEISDILSPFLQSVNVIVTPQANANWDLVQLPKDYQHFASARWVTKDSQACGKKSCETISGKDGEPSKCDFVLDDDELALAEKELWASIRELPVTKVPNARWTSVTQHAFLSPAATGEPACTQFDKGLKIAPKGTGVIIMDYFRLPKEATFEYDILNAGTQKEYLQYNEASSQKLEYSPTMIPEFESRLKKRYATFTNQPGLYQQGQVESR